MKDNKKDVIKEYLKKDGSKACKFNAYLGVDPITGKQRRTTRRGFRTRREAKLALAKLTTEVQENGLPEQTKNMTFQQVYELWEPIYETTVKESTYQVQMDAIRLHILPNFGQMKISKITTAYCQKVVNNWHSYYKKTPNLIGLTSRILKYACDNLNLLRDNPMDKVIRPKHKNTLKEDNYEAPHYDEKQLRHFLNEVQEKMDLQTYVIFRVICFTGIREGEMCGLRWSDFDEVNGTISIKRTVARGKNYKRILQNPKSDAGERIISLDDETIKVLRDWKVQQAKNMLMLGYNTNKKNQYIITNDKNEYQYAQYPYARLVQVRKKCNIDKITVHGLRHTHCTLLFEAGASLKEVQDRMGHEDYDMVLRIYTHINKQKKSEIGNSFAKMLENY